MPQSSQGSSFLEKGAKEALRVKAASLGSVRLSQKRFYDVRVREE